MVWKDQVNVLDQRRIFRLLAKGPRLESYLIQLKTVDKLDFASWGGFAQNFADRRIPFEHSSSSAYWERARGDSLLIPTFLAGPSGPYLPGSAIKGALRTGMLFLHWKDGALPNLERQGSERISSRPGADAEEQALGTPSFSFMRAVGVSDSRPVAASLMKLYLLRVSTLHVRPSGRFELGWKQAPRGSADGRHPEESTPLFAEMAPPGAVFEGTWRENSYLAGPEVLRSLRWRQPVTTASLLDAANQCAAQLLGVHKQYAASAGLGLLDKNLDQLLAELEAARASGHACLLSLGWGSGLLAKTGWLDTEAAAYRQLLREVPLYSKAIQSGLPFPKTRHIVFLSNQPATLPGWVRLEIAE
jgi:CRISPR-associated protein Csm5